MRTQKQIVFYKSILDVLSEPGCPFCRFLKDYQAAHLQGHMSRNISHLCSFHTWALAAVQNALATAQVFLDLIEGEAVVSGEDVICDVCREISAEEERRIREFVGCMHRRDVSDWLRADAVLCVPHGAKLRRHVQPVAAARIDTIVEDYRQQLTQELKVLRDTPQAGRPGWGSLGRVAEFLVSQRGLRS